MSNTYNLAQKTDPKGRFFVVFCRKMQKIHKKCKKNTKKFAYIKIKYYLCTVKQKQTTKRRGGNPKQRHKIMTTTSKYFNSAEITNVRQTICTLLSELLNASSFTNKDGNNQVVVTLNPEEDGTQWLMFVYYDAKRESFYYSFQDQDYNDTVFTYGVGMMDMVEQIEAEIERVHGFEWIEIDID